MSTDLMSTDLMMLAWVAGLTAVLWLPYILMRVMTFGLMGALSYKYDQEKIADWAERAKKAHYNAIENLAPFACLVLVAHLTQSANETTAMAATVYFWARVAHYILHIANIPFVRTLAFFVGWLAMAAIFYQIVT